MCWKIGGKEITNVSFGRKLLIIHRSWYIDVSSVHLLVDPLIARVNASYKSKSPFHVDTDSLASYWMKMQKHEKRRLYTAHVYVHICRHI